MLSHGIVVTNTAALLKAAHQGEKLLLCVAGFLHRDLKPSNILLAEDGTVKLGDFGMACLLTSVDCVHPHPNSHAVASRWYRAPELLFGARRYGVGVDMWAVGCIFAELLGTAYFPCDGLPVIDCVRRKAVACNLQTDLRNCSSVVLASRRV